MSIDYAHTRTAQQKRAAKAQTLARWCYARGLIDARLLEADPQLRRTAARSAGVSPPHEAPGQPGETWQLVLELITRKLAWDREHQIRTPRPARCVSCAVHGDWCDRHQPRCCRVCGGALHWVLLEEGASTHPSCDLVDVDRTSPPTPAAAAPATVDDATLY